MFTARAAHLELFINRCSCVPEYFSLQSPLPEYFFCLVFSFLACSFSYASKMLETDILNVIFSYIMKTNVISMTNLMLPFGALS